MGMMSDLTDDLLLEILSSLNFKDVVATSVLSRQWRCLWKLLPKLKMGKAECSIRVPSSSALISTPQLVESLDFKLMENFDRRIHDWVGSAVYRGLREVRIELLYTSLAFPDSLFACKTLETLILSRLELADVPRYNRFCLSLKTLGLLSVKFWSDESVKKLLSVCPVLEDLVVRRSTYVQVNVFTINVPTLRSLSIKSSFAVSQGVDRAHGFVINAPSLRYLDIIDRNSNLLMITSNMPELVKANVEVLCDQSESLFKSLTSIRHLSLCSKTSNIPYHANTWFFFLEHLELSTCSWEWCTLLFRILKDAPRLRLLKLFNLKNYCAHSYHVDQSLTDHHYRWSQPSSVPECFSSHLEILEWRQYNGTKPEKQVAKYILANACHLKTATFSSKSTEKLYLFNKLESLPISSKACQLFFY